VTCDIGELNSRESVTLFIEVTAAVDGVARNRAEVWSDNTDPNLANNISTVNTTIHPVFYYIYLPIVVKG
jgi:hypothetical protein